MARLALAALLLGACASPPVPVKPVPQATEPAVPKLEPRVSRSHERAVLHWQRKITTAYCYTGSRNAAGRWPRRGTAAGNAYPLGTRLLVRGYGVIVIEDRSASGATDVDLYLGDDPNCAAVAAAFGRQTRDVATLGQVR